jgi:hypothetical protein
MNSVEPEDVIKSGMRSPVKLASFGANMSAPS